MAEESRKLNRRRFKRWAVSVPCTITWEQQEVIVGTVSDLSFDGALIRAERAPAEGTDVAVRFAFRDHGLHLQGRVTSEVIHTEEEGQEQIFGVRFETSVEKCWVQLTPVIQTLMEEAGETEETEEN